MPPHAPLTRDGGMTKPAPGILPDPNGGATSAAVEDGGSEIEKFRIFW
jgi:hypothetical protein